MTIDRDDDPFLRFQAWLTEAERFELNDPNAMALATVDGAGRPAVRMVLLKGVDATGFVFYSNQDSRKGRELAANPQAALCFYWKSLKRQVRVEGPVSPVAAAEADAYFASRSRGSQIGAWASRQSQPLEGRWELERRVAETTLKYALGSVPRPPFWVGYRLVPEQIEFWQDRPFRLHERQVFRRQADSAEALPAAPWTAERLFP